jgi:hypothetical protein
VRVSEEAVEVERWKATPLVRPRSKRWNAGWACRQTCVLPVQAAKSSLRLHGISRPDLSTAWRATSQRGVTSSWLPNGGMNEKSGHIRSSVCDDVVGEKITWAKVRAD